MGKPLSETYVRRTAAEGGARKSPRHETSALDPELVGEVLDVIKKVAAQGYTMLLVSHEMNFIRHVSNRVIFLDKGHVVEDGTPKEVFEHPQNQRTREFFSKMHIMAQPEYVI